MAIRLEDVKPARTTFTLPTSGTTLTFRPFSLDDEYWMNQEYGSGIEALFKECNFKEIFRIAFRMIENKEVLKKRTVKFINEDGDEKEMEIGGIKLLHALSYGFEEKMLILTSLLNCIGISRPMMDELAKADQEDQKKSLELKQTGAKSSTSSPANTDGPLNTSSL